MKIAIIGAGFTGLVAAWKLKKAGHDVTIYEGEKQAGGLASGFKNTGWDYFLEKHYHHVFATDKNIQDILSEFDLKDELYFCNVKTSTLCNEKIFRLDSPLSLLKFSQLPLLSRLRTGATLAFLKLFPFGQLLEKITAERFLKITMGTTTWKVLWEPLFKGKFGSFSNKINAAWFWARIYTRSQQLGYFKGGFQSLINKMVAKLEQAGIEIVFESLVKKIEFNDKIMLSLFNKHKESKALFDKVLFTASADDLLKVVDDFDEKYQASLQKLESLGAMTLVVQLNKSFFKDETYWLNINQTGWPFLAVVEHTNLVEPQQYNEKNILYIGKYLAVSDKFFEMDAKEVLKVYQPYLEQLFSGFSKHIDDIWLFKDEFAQPIVKVNHSKLVPQIKTPINNLYWASMQHVYPFDRGVNYAVRLGKEAAQKIIQNS